MGLVSYSEKTNAWKFKIQEDEKQINEIGQLGKTLGVIYLNFFFNFSFWDNFKKIDKKLHKTVQRIPQIPWVLTSSLTTTQLQSQKN